jgi:histidinol-phosphate aminotransferase
MLQQVSEKTRLIFIANPNNPTGTFLKRATLEKFIAALPQQVICVLDEAYFEYVDEPEYPDSVSWLERFPNVIITRTFSKAYGLAGLRIGYSISNAEIADLLNRVRQPFNNNSLALVAAEAVLHDDIYLQQAVSTNNQGMQQLTSAFKRLDLSWIPSVANFVSVDLKSPALTVYESLLKKGVIVRPVANYELPNHLRISIGTEAENQFFIDALADILPHV